ncbi:hypothetical protein ABQE69_04195 [Mycolicibacillus trivialis]|nr:hypothetical protein [Mycolicibacillus trivialis]
MRAEEGDESIDDYAREAEEAREEVVEEGPWWRRLGRALGLWRS